MIKLWIDENTCEDINSRKNTFKAVVSRMISINGVQNGFIKRVQRQFWLDSRWFGSYNGQLISRFNSMGYYDLFSSLMEGLGYDIILKPRSNKYDVIISEDDPYMTFINYCYPRFKLIINKDKKMRYSDWVLEFHDDVIQLSDKRINACLFVIDVIKSCLLHLFANTQVPKIIQEFRKELTREFYAEPVDRKRLFLYPEVKKRVRDGLTDLIP